MWSSLLYRWWRFRRCQFSGPVRYANIVSFAKKCYQVGWFKGIRSLSKKKTTWEMSVRILPSCLYSDTPSLSESRTKSASPFHASLQENPPPLGPFKAWQSESSSLATKVIPVPCALRDCSYQSPIHRKKVFTRPLSTKKSCYLGRGVRTIMSGTVISVMNGETEC